MDEVVEILIPKKSVVGDTYGSGYRSFSPEFRRNKEHSRVECGRIDAIHFVDSSEKRRVLSIDIRMNGDIRIFAEGSMLEPKVLHSQLDKGGMRVLPDANTIVLNSVTVKKV